MLAKGVRVKRRRGWRGEQMLLALIYAFCVGERPVTVSYQAGKWAREQAYMVILRERDGQQGRLVPAYTVILFSRDNLVLNELARLHGLQPLIRDFVHGVARVTRSGCACCSPAATTASTGCCPPPSGWNRREPGGGRRTPAQMGKGAPPSANGPQQCACAGPAQPHNGKTRSCPRSSLIPLPYQGIGEGVCRSPRSRAAAKLVGQPPVSLPENKSASEPSRRRRWWYAAVLTHLGLWIAGLYLFSRYFGAAR